MTGARATPAGGALVWAANGRALAVLGLVILGAALAPIYPLVTADTPRRVGERYATHAIGFKVNAAYLAAAAIPGMVGLAATWYGLDVVGLALVSLAVAVGALHEATGVGEARGDAAMPSRVGWRRV